MAKVLFANFFAWSHSKQLDTAAGSQTLLYNMKLFKISTGSPAREGSVMPTDGHFVGMIIFVEANANTVNNTTFDIVRIPRISNSYDYADQKVLGTITVPPFEIGCFYTDPDTSEGSREYNQYDNLQLQVTQDGTQDTAKLTKLHVLIGLDCDGNALIGPYTDNFNPPFTF